MNFEDRCLLLFLTLSHRHRLPAGAWRQHGHLAPKGGGAAGQADHRRRGSRQVALHRSGLAGDAVGVGKGRPRAAGDQREGREAEGAGADRAVQEGDEEGGDAGPGDRESDRMGFLLHGEGRRGRERGERCAQG
eukprot:755399-Hanusia_phi.AAC.4